MKATVLLAAKTTDMKDYIKPTKRDFIPYLYVFHAGTNDSPLHKENCETVNDNVA